MEATEMADKYTLDIYYASFRKPIKTIKQKENRIW
jgi:hypothetical protein